MDDNWIIWSKWCHPQGPKNYEKLFLFFVNLAEIFLQGLFFGAGKMKKKMVLVKFIDPTASLRSFALRKVQENQAKTQMKTI